jgi:hypothetical protein
VAVVVDGVNSIGNTTLAVDGAIDPVKCSIYALPNVILLDTEEAGHALLMDIILISTLAVLPAGTVYNVVAVLVLTILVVTDSNFTSLAILFKSF